MKLKNKIIPLLSAIGCSVIASATISSCGGLSKDLTENMIDRKDGLNISEHVTFQQDVESALKSSSGETAFKKSIVDDLLYSWGKTNINNFSKEDQWKKWDKDINDSYKDKIQSYKDNHKSDWGYYFQNEVLDPAGGTEEAYKKNQFVEKIRAEFNNLIFKQSYLSLGSEQDPSKYNLKNGEVIKSYNDETLKENSGMWSQINFFARSNGDYSPENPKTLDNQYARIQKKAFDEYTAKNMPVSIAMSLWKYGDPYDGMKSIYNENKFKVAEEFKPSYEFPAFSSRGGDATQSKKTLEKFIDFRDELKNNNFFQYGSSNNGLIQTDLLMNYTEDSSTTITANLAHLYDDKASSAGGLETVFVTTVSQLVQEVSGITKPSFAVPAIAIDKIGSEKDLLTAFISNDDTLDTSTKWKNLNKIYNVTPTDDSFDLFATDSTLYTGKYRYITNTVRLQNNTGTAMPFMLTRDEFGIHLIGLDGAGYLAAPKTTGSNAIVGEPWSQERENQILKLRAALNDEPSGLKDEIKKYYDSNIDDLLFKIAVEDASTTTDTTITENIIFTNAKDILSSGTIKKYINSTSDLSSINEKLTTYKAANEKLITRSKKYTDAYAPSQADSTKPAFVSTYLANGLASPLLLESFDADKTNLYAQESRFSVTKYAEGVYDNWKSGDIVLSTADYNKKISDQKANVKALLAAFSVAPKISNDGNEKYSENILSSSSSEYITKAMNKALMAFNSDGSSAANMEKNWAFSEYLKDADFKDFDTEMAYQYYFPKMLASDKRMVNFKLSDVADRASLKGLIDNWKAIEETIKQTTNSESANQERIDWLTYQASLFWLTKDSNKNLINYLRDQITWDNPAVVAWIDKDNSELNTDFGSQNNITVTNNLYDWSSNYMGQYDGVYSNATAEKPTSYVEFPEYSSLAQMPFVQDAGTTFKIASGFLGLQTASNASKLPATINSALFGENGIYYSNPESDYIGTLYQFGTRDLLIKRVDGRSSSEINELTEKVRKLCPTLSINDWANKTKENIFKPGDADMGKDYSPGDTIPSYIKEKRFEKGVKDVAVFTDKMFLGINNDGNKGVRELVNRQTKKHVFPDKDAASSSRLAFMQMNYIDLYEDRDPLKQPTSSEYSNVTTRLNTIITSPVLKAITVQIAQDATIQSRAVSDVISKVYKGKKVNVFTRYMNDQLGQTWVADWKKKI